VQFGSVIRTTNPSKLHWNYFLALERDLEATSRYIEFGKANFRVYSIELAHLLFAAASEVDVIAKLLCKRFAPMNQCGNINQYRPVLLGTLADLPKTKVFVPRYGLSFRPWDNWGRPTNPPTNPDWWGSYNKVKHERDAHFPEATLKNALNALGALLIFDPHVPPLQPLSRSCRRTSSESERDYEAARTAIKPFAVTERPLLWKPPGTLRGRGGMPGGKRTLTGLWPSITRALYRLNPSKPVRHSGAPVLRARSECEFRGDRLK
jgi:hypothetical protein